MIVGQSMRPDYGATHTGSAIDVIYGVGTIYDMQSMGQRIRQARKDLGLTQVDLAEACDIDQSTVSDIERGENDSFSGRTLLKMAEKLGKSPYYIVYGVGADDHNATLEEVELLVQFQRLTSDDRAALLRMARALAGSNGNKTSQHRDQ